MDNRKLIKMAKVLSSLFMPLYAPLWVFFGLFLFSYLRMLPWGYKLFIIVLVYVFTVFVPTLGITTFRLFKKWTRLELSHREHRHMPYIVTLLSYAACLVIMTKMNTAMFFRGVVMSALICQIICVTVNAWWKVSTHMVGMGGLVGALNAFSILFLYNPLWPFCALLLLSGALGTSRIILRQHSLAQVLVGFGIGYACTMTFILMSWM
jgi:membrane-associated phospholipid phosphatase